MAIRTLFNLSVSYIRRRHGVTGGMRETNEDIQRLRRCMAPNFSTRRRGQVVRVKRERMSETLGRFIDRNLARSLIHAGPKPSSFGGCGLIDSRDATVWGPRVTKFCWSRALIRIIWRHKIIYLLTYLLTYLLDKNVCTRGWGRRGYRRFHSNPAGMHGSICCGTPCGDEKESQKWRCNVP